MEVAMEKKASLRNHAKRDPCDPPAIGSDSLKAKIPEMILLDAKSSAKVSALTMHSDHVVKIRNTMLKSKHKSKCIELEKSRNEKKQLQTEVKLLKSKLEKTTTLSLDQKTVLDTAHSRSDMLQSRMTKERESRVDSLKAVRQTEQVKAEMQEILNHTTEVENGNDKLVQVLANVKRTNAKLNERVKKQSNQMNNLKTDMQNINHSNKVELSSKDRTIARLSNENKSKKN